MSQRRGALSQAFLAFNARDIDAFVALCDPGSNFVDMSQQSAVPATTAMTDLRIWHATSRTLGARESACSRRCYFEMATKRSTFGVLIRPGDGRVVPRS